ncbi:cysteine peptidase family C39 domain-containing protein [Persephonella sp.]
MRVKSVAVFFLFLFTATYGVVLDVPFVKQKSQFCGPSALSSVFKYYGIEVSQDKIAEKVYMPQLKGALITDLENYATSAGFKTKLCTGSIETIKSFLDRKIPVIVLVDYGWWVFSQPHYLVVVGYNEEGFIVHDGYKAFKKIKYTEFIKIWEKSGNSYLAVYR